MRLALPLVPVAALVLALGCRPRAEAPVYGPWEEGLTLAYEDPSQPQPRRSNDRLQVRVSRSEIAPGAPRLVQLQLTSLQGQTTVTVRHQDGGIALLGEDGRPVAQSLPPGFPATAAWSDRGTQFRVVGRATWSGAALLPPTADPVGVWVEARPVQGPLRRTLYLPNLGEAESLELRENAWVAVNRLVARGFIDLPSAPRP